MQRMTRYNFFVLPIRSRYKWKVPLPVPVPIKILNNFPIPVPMPVQVQDSDTEENRALYKAFGQDLQVLRYRDPQCVYAYHHAPPLCSLVFLVCLIRSDEQKEQSLARMRRMPTESRGESKLLASPSRGSSLLNHKRKETTGGRAEEETKVKCKQCQRS